MRLRNAVAASACVGLMSLAVAAAEVPPTERIQQWQDAINRASEAGDLRRVEALRLELADFSGQVGDYQGAARQYDLLLAMRPGSGERVRLYLRMGHMKDALKDFQGAISAYENALHDDRNSYDANLELSREYAKVDLNTRAVKGFQRCIALNPRDERPRRDLGATYARLGYVNKAIESFRQAIKIQPQPESYLGLADCYVHEGDISKATETLLRAKTALPRAEYDVRLGDIYQQQSDLGRASASWEEALRVDSRRDDVRVKLLMVYDRLHRKPETDKMLRMLLANYPRSPLVHFMAAWIYLNRGDRRQSEHEALAAEKLAPTEMVQHFNEGLLLQLKK